MFMGPNSSQPCSHRSEKKMNIITRRATYLVSAKKKEESWLKVEGREANRRPTFATTAAGTMIRSGYSNGYKKENGEEEDEWRTGCSTKGGFFIPD